MTHREDMSEDEQWAAAAALLEAHGKDVGSFLLAHVRSQMDAGDDHGARTWLGICSKVLRLYGTEGGA